MRMNWTAIALVAGWFAVGTPARSENYIRVTNCGDPAPIAGAGNGYMDAHGNICTASGGSGGTVTPAARTATTSTTLVANQIITASAGSLYSFDVQADSTLAASAWYIMVYNLAAAPVDGAVMPLKCYQMAAGTLGMSAAFPSPIRFSTGIVIGVSTTGCFIKTESAHAFISGDF